jgi:Lon protease-like protein
MDGPYRVMDYDMNPESVGLVDFSGEVCLFPLPNMVLFPHVVQPLHIFEPRYRQMVSDSLAGDRLIAMSLLSQRSDQMGEGEPPPIHPVVCVGRIFREEKLPDGRFNLLLHGVARARVIEEINTGKMYRMAQVELLDEIPAASKDSETGLRASLLQQIDTWFGSQPEARTQIRKLFKSDLPLGTLADILAFALPLDVEVKQELLELVDIEDRAEMLLTSLRENPAPLVDSPKPRRKFPPDFSLN